MILFYAAKNDRVVHTLEAQTAQFRVVRCRSFETMLERLRTPRHGLEVALVVISEKDEMERLSRLRNLLRDLRLVVVLTRRDDETVTWAHKMAPRFIAYADNGYDQVGAVITKMMRSSRHQPAARGG